MCVNKYVRHGLVARNPGDHPPQELITLDDHSTI